MTLITTTIQEYLLEMMVAVLGTMIQVPGLTLAEMTGELVEMYVVVVDVAEVTQVAGVVVEVVMGEMGAAVGVEVVGAVGVVEDVVVNFKCTHVNIAVNLNM